jgi:adenosylmethionine-8-amino-7-oxononanoate aminotransferase
MGAHVWRREPFEPILLSNISHVSPCYAYRGRKDGESDAGYVARLADELEAEFQRLGPDTVCGFVAEPVVGAVRLSPVSGSHRISADPTYLHKALGCVPAVPGYFQAMKAVCDKYGALFILDEVMCGIGRVGTLHAWEQEGVVPDIQTIGKGLGGGYAPVAGVLISEKVVNVLDKGTGVFRHGHTYQGHPVSCAAALAVQKVIQEEKLLENIRAMGTILESELKSRLSDHPYVGDIRGRGLFWGVCTSYPSSFLHSHLTNFFFFFHAQIEFVKDKKTKEPFDPKLGIATRVQNAALSPEYGFAIYPGTGTVDGVRGDHVLLAPPYNTNKDEIILIASLTEKVIKDVFAKITSQ